jgi:hypothetical protein
MITLLLLLMLMPDGSGTGWQLDHHDLHIRSS